ncbi:hypothetical protein B0J18DRAFT_473493 [Chaetomium sp. MPI-SDFR-AT-0129]|nr:hypothetical protein B0J18DRAFT_473493 [Chaetomium sp. MPI-SDFR-AT-0129]
MPGPGTPLPRRVKSPRPGTPRNTRIEIRPGQRPSNSNGLRIPAYRPPMSGDPNARHHSRDNTAVPCPPFGFIDPAGYAARAEQSPSVVLPPPDPSVSFPRHRDEGPRVRPPPRPYSTMPRDRPPVYYSPPILRPSSSLSTSNPRSQPQSTYPPPQQHQGHHERRHPLATDRSYEPNTPREHTRGQQPNHQPTSHVASPLQKGPISPESPAKMIQVVKQKMNEGGQKVLGLEDAMRNAKPFTAGTEPNNRDRQSVKDGDNRKAIIPGPKTKPRNSPLAIKGRNMGPRREYYATFTDVCEDVEEDDSDGGGTRLAVVGDRFR